MKVLVACEFSGIVREAFRSRGHDAISCDLEASLLPGPHVRGDVRPLLKEDWDLIIAHPPCTYLANSGVHALYYPDGTVVKERLEKVEEAAEFFYLFLKSKCRRVCIENPVMHSVALKLINFIPYTQLIQPYSFGHPETKRTCLWLKGLHKLRPTKVVKAKYSATSNVETYNRRMLRSITFTGIAEAMAKQWGT